MTALPKLTLQQLNTRLLESDGRPLLNDLMSKVPLGESAVITTDGQPKEIWPLESDFGRQVMEIASNGLADLYVYGIRPAYVTSVYRGEHWSEASVIAKDLDEAELIGGHAADIDILRKVIRIY